MTDHTDLISAARRAEGSELLPKVSLGHYRADALLQLLADALEAQAASSSAMRAAQGGLWGQYAPHAGPFKDLAKAARASGAKWDFDSSHDVSELFPDGTRRRVGTFQCSEDAEEAEQAVNGVRSGALVPAQAWRPIENEPTGWAIGLLHFPDVGEFYGQSLAARKGRTFVVCYWDGETWRERCSGRDVFEQRGENGEPTHWMPLPPAPQEGEFASTDGICDRCAECDCERGGAECSWIKTNREGE